MHQVKLFKGLESGIAELEAEVNEWLTSSGARVVNVIGNMSPQSGTADGQDDKLGRSYTPSDVFMVIVYEK